MDKNIYKLKPNSYWEIGKTESWLTDMARKGLYPKKLRRCFAIFQRGTPQDMKYRIDITNDHDKLSESQRQDYAKHGWEYVLSYGHIHIFNSPSYLEAGEIFLTHYEGDNLLYSLYRSSILCIFSLIISTLIYLDKFRYIDFYRNNFYSSLINGKAFNFIAIICAYLYLIISNIKHIILYKKTMKSLSKPNSINHNVRWKNHKGIGLIFKLIMFSIVFFFISTNIISAVISKELPTPNVPSSIPIIILSEVEDNKDLIIESSHYRGIDNEPVNMYTSDWSFFAPIQYDSSSNGFISGQKWPNRSDTYSPSIYTKTYKLRFSSMADNLFEELISDYNDYTYSTKKEYVDPYSSGFDLLAVYKKDYSIEVFACRGKALVHTTYFGTEENIDLIINAVSEKLDLIAE